MQVGLTFIQKTKLDKLHKSSP